MSTMKTQVEDHKVEKFVRELFQNDSLTLHRISDGELAQAFFFDLPDGPRVIRVRLGSNTGFLKDQFAFEHFSSGALPIPRITQIGEIEDELFYAISERAPGKPLDQFSHDEINSLVPEIISRLDTIHEVKPAGGGYGTWDLTGQGEFGSWREAVSANLQLDDDETKSAEFYDNSLVAGLHTEISALLKFIPEERVLLHSDYGFNNALSDGKRITGVIDWENSGYGDYMFDVAWLDFWVDSQGYAKAFEEHYAKQNRNVSHFNERLACYKLVIGLGSLGFFARSRQREKYEFVQEVIGRIRHTLTA
jgi:hygromycin-B 4-O-kinase